MRTSIFTFSLLVLAATAIALYAQEPSKTSAPKIVVGGTTDIASQFANAATEKEVFDKISLPKNTPFDADQEKRLQYSNSYREGYIWAAGQHFMCPPDPKDTNLHAIRGWVDGWKAGAKNGGTAGLPAKYAPLVVWGHHPETRITK